MDEMQKCWEKKLYGLFYLLFFFLLTFVLLHTFLLLFFLDVDNQIIMKQHYHITKTCKTSSSEELIFRETSTRKKVQ